MDPHSVAEVGVKRPVSVVVVEPLHQTVEGEIGREGELRSRGVGNIRPLGGGSQIQLVGPKALVVVGGVQYLQQFPRDWPPRPPEL